MSQFPIHAPSPAGCEWEGWHRKETCAWTAWNWAWEGSCSGSLWEQRLSCRSVCFWQRVASFGQRHSVTHHILTPRKNNGESTQWEILNKLQDAIHIIMSKHACTHVCVTLRALISWIQAMGTKPGKVRHVQQEWQLWGAYTALCNTSKKLL